MIVSVAVVCLKHHRIYKHIEVEREDLRFGETLTGICPACMEPVDMRLFGGKREPAALDVEAFR